MKKSLIALSIALVFAVSMPIVLAAEREFPKTESLGVIQPTMGRGVTQISGAPFALNDTMEAAVTRVMFPAAMCTFSFAEEGSSLYTGDQLNVFMNRNWNDDVIYGLGAPSTIANTVMAWTHRMGWIGPVGKAITPDGDYNFAYLTAPQVDKDDYTEFQMVRLNLVSENGQWFTPLATFHFGNYEDTGESTVIIDSGAADETAMQVEVTDA